MGNDHDSVSARAVRQYLQSLQQAGVSHVPHIEPVQIEAPQVAILQEAQGLPEHDGIAALVAEQQGDVAQWLVFENGLDVRHDGRDAAASDKCHISLFMAWVERGEKATRGRHHFQLITGFQLAIGPR